MQSFKLAGQECYVLQFPESRITPALQWTQSAGLIWYASDRGAVQDVYESEVTFFDTEQRVNAVYTLLENNRESFTLSAFADSVFAPNVDHTQNITATITNPYNRTFKATAVPNTGMYQLNVSLRAVQPSFSSTSPSLASLRLQPGFLASSTYESKKEFAYDETPFYKDRRDDTGVFRASFVQTTAEIKPILSYLTTTARGNSIAFPNIGVGYPFGPSKGVYSSLNCRVKNYSFKRKSFPLWQIDLELVEA